MTQPFRVGCFEKIYAENANESCPEPRSGHRVVVDEGNLYSLGGYNPQFWDLENTDQTNYPLFRELWRFNFATKKWSKEVTSGHMPLELASHSAISSGRKILVFGGTGVPFGTCSSNDLYEYDLDTKQWTYLQCGGVLPERKYGHAMIIHGDSLYVIGGTTGYVYNSSVHVLDLNSLQWRAPSTSDDPSGRYRHEVAYDGKAIYMLGGGTAVTVVGFNEIPTFDLVTEEWKTVLTRPDPQHGFPSPRRCHGCVQHKNMAYIIGGLTANSILGDIWRFCLDTQVWAKLPVSMPEPAYFHSVGISKEGCISVFGGVVCIDNLRSNDLYQIWVDIPSLKEMCWQTICRKVKNIGQLKKSFLYKMGIPAEFIERIS